MLVPSSEIEGRVAALQARMTADGIAAAVFTQTVDLHYLTGMAQQAHLILPAEGEPLLLVRRDLARARQESPLERIEPFDGLDQLSTALAAVGVAKAARIGFELDVLPVTHFRRYERVLPDAHLVDVGRLMREIRAVKSPWELERMREAASMTEAALHAAAARLAAGMTEAELASVVAGELTRLGHPGILRMRGLNQEMPLAHVFAGPDAGAPSGFDVPFAGLGHTPAFPQGAGMRPIGKGEAVVIDLGSSVDGYVVDTTRTLSVGPLAADLAAAHDVCRAIHRDIRSAAKAGSSTVHLYRRAVERAEDAGYGRNFMGAAPSQVAFIGHGVGLEVDELPVLARGGDRGLEIGNVIALEPKILLPGRGAVGIEDTCVVDVDGLEPLAALDDGVWEV